MEVPVLLAAERRGEERGADPGVERQVAWSRKSPILSKVFENPALAPVGTDLYALAAKLVTIASPEIKPTFNC